MNVWEDKSFSTLCIKNLIFTYYLVYGSIALLSHNTLKWSMILGLSFFVRCWWPRESMLLGSSALSEFHTSLTKVLTLWHCVKVKQHYQGGLWSLFILLFSIILDHLAHCGMTALKHEISFSSVFFGLFMALKRHHLEHTSGKLDSI